LEDFFLARLSAGKPLVFIGAILCIILIACGIPPKDKYLAPRILFTSGSVFLDSAATVALRGSISFESSKAAQSGSFQLFLIGHDSLSFLVEGPLGSDIFKMIVAGDSAYLLSNKDEGWVTIRRGEEISIADFGIDNISPFLLGLYAFPQYYLHSQAESNSSDEYLLNGDKLVTQPGRNDREFMMINPHSFLAAAYGKRKDFNGGYYPSFITIFVPGRDWEINLSIEKIIINPTLQVNIWKRD
jgi:hypothetical protein